MRRSLWPTRRAAVVVARDAGGATQWLDIGEIAPQIEAAAARGCVAVDLVGGEPAQHPRLKEIRDCLQSLGLHGSLFCSCRDEASLQRALDLSFWEVICVAAGRSEVTARSLVSVARLLESASAVVRLKWFFEPASFAGSIGDLRMWIDTLRPRYLELVYRMKPWSLGRKAISASVCEDWSERVREFLDGITAASVRYRLRYVPLCLFPGRESLIVNIPQMLFDPLSWDYGLSPKEASLYLSAAESFCRQFNVAHGPCGMCLARGICGGAPRSWVRETGFSGLRPMYGDYEEPLMFWRRRWATAIIEEEAACAEPLLSEAEEPCTLVSPEEARKTAEAGRRPEDWAYAWISIGSIQSISPSWNAYLAQILDETEGVVAVAPLPEDFASRVRCQEGLLPCTNPDPLAGVLVRRDQVESLLEGDRRQAVARLVAQGKVILATGVRVSRARKMPCGLSSAGVSREGSKTRRALEAMEERS
ncbi:MAG: hypothetical protein ONB23_04620 [candidate division KSB1 bacterium]|nr:hypothetical protein [candidate division KSB1 bacterium]